jgi:hypothetical protein
MGCIKFERTADRPGTNTAPPSLFDYLARNQRRAFGREFRKKFDDDFVSLLRHVLSEALGGPTPACARPPRFEAGKDVLDVLFEIDGNLYT